MLPVSDVLRAPANGSRTQSSSPTEWSLACASSLSRPAWLSLGKTCPDGATFSRWRLPRATLALTPSPFT